MHLANLLLFLGQLMSWQVVDGDGLAAKPLRLVGKASNSYDLPETGGVTNNQNRKVDIIM